MNPFIFFGLAGYGLIVCYLFFGYGMWGALLAADFSLVGWLLYAGGHREATTDTESQYITIKRNKK